MTERSGHAAAGNALLRITLGVIIVVTWFDNLADDLYTADGFEGLLNWLFTPVADGGNGSSLGFYDSIVDATIVPVSALYTKVQLVVELVLGIGLILGAFTRVCSLIAAIFFFNLFLAYFGGDEWIWIYVLLFVSSIAVLVADAGRKWGLDPKLEQSLGSSPLGRLL